MEWLARLAAATPAAATARRDRASVLPGPAAPGSLKAWHSLTRGRPMAVAKPAPRPVVGWVLLVLSVLASAAAVVLLAITGYLLSVGYSGGNSPTSVSGLAFPFAFSAFLLGALPAALLSGGLWTAYFLWRNRARSSAVR
jgi:hypothetical protein